MGLLPSLQLPNLKFTDARQQNKVFNKENKLFDFPSHFTLDGFIDHTFNTWLPPWSRPVTCKEKNGSDNQLYRLMVISRQKHRLQMNLHQHLMAFLRATSNLQMSIHSQLDIKKIHVPLVGHFLSGNQEAIEVSMMYIYDGIWVLPSKCLGARILYYSLYHDGYDGLHLKKPFWLMLWSGNIYHLKSYPPIVNSLFELSNMLGKSVNTCYPWSRWETELGP